MNKILNTILKNRISNIIFTFLLTVLTFTGACFVSAGVGSLIVIFVSGGVAFKVIEWSDSRHKELNGLKLNNLE